MPLLKLYVFLSGPNYYKTHNMLKFGMILPYVYLHGTNTSNIIKYDIELPGSRKIMGYLIKYKLNLTETTTPFTSISEHEVFVYYEHPEVYSSANFPKIISPMRPW